MGTIPKEPNTQLCVGMKWNEKDEKTLGEHYGKRFDEIAKTEDGFHFFNWLRWLDSDDIMIEHVQMLTGETSYILMLAYLFRIWFKYFKVLNKEYDQYNLIVQDYYKKI